MSTQPTGWQQPKTNWQAADAVTPADLNRNEGNAAAIETGNRTVDSAQAPTSNVGTLRQLVDWFANRIKAISGTVNWWDTPPTTLTAAKAHIDAQTNPHNTTAAQVGALVSIEGVSNAGSNIDLVPGGAITISGNDVANTITISETHSGVAGNPHNTTAAQVGALVSVDGVSNAGGNIDLVPGANIAITPNEAANTITIAVSGTVANAANAANATNAGNSNLLDNMDSSAFVQTGANNAANQRYQAMVIPTDTRSMIPTAWHGTFTDKPTHYEIRDGATVRAVVDITYNGDGSMTQYRFEWYGQVVVTWNHTWSGMRPTGTTKVIS